MKSALVAASIGVLLVCFFLLSFANPLLCSTGCGNLLEPVFRLAHHAFGAWGVRTVLLALALLLFWAALRARE
jgi:hypothetical protein